MRKVALIPVAVLFLCANQVLAADLFSSKSEGTTAASFLKNAVGARAIGMGEAYAAVADDVNSIFWNPAGLNKISGSEITLMHAVWIEGVAYDYVAYAQRLGELGSLGGAVNYLWMDEIEKRDAFTGARTGGTFSSYDLAVTLAYANQIGAIPLGINLRFIQCKIDDISASAFAADIGGKYKFTDSLALGVVIQNLGTRIKFDEEEYSLPFNVKIGSAYKVIEALTLALDVNFPIDNDVNVHFGGEYVYAIVSDMTVAGRVGYKSTTINDIDALSGLSLGLGYAWQGIALDYAWTPYGLLGDTHRISLSISF